ncbi:MAG: M81 family metallopeptidase, partial [Gammaproteobacteria bacterium]|nr:M81 family metallopeptidase [Gammaproteobacteria bacterium]
MAYRFVVAGISHETNTFSPIPTPLKAFAVGEKDGRPPSGDDAIAQYLGTRTCLGAFIDLARAEGAEIVLPVAASAAPSGPVSDDAFEQMVDSVCQAVTKGCDAVLLDLHGAMVTQSYSDGEGELLRRLRTINEDVPVAVALDFHTNMSQAMIDHASVITGYCTYPHIDMHETAERCGRTLIRALKREVSPVIHWRWVPMLTHTLRQTPSMQPMKDIMDCAMAAERSGEVLNSSVFGGFPMADIPHVGLSIVTVSDGDTTRGKTLETDLAQLAWQRRAEFVYDVEPVADSIAYAKALDDGPIVLVDHGDNVFSGGTQDVMETVEEAINQHLENVAVGPIWDPQSVATMINVGVGAEVTLALGGKTSMPALDLEGRPLTVTGTVLRVTDGRYRVTCPMMTGVTLDHGPSAVLDTGAMEILVCSERMEAFDLGIFRHAGI